MSQSRKMNAVRIAGSKREVLCPTFACTCVPVNVPVNVPVKLVL